jgi:ABC-type antimicrobial peptide transport system permease subunit
VAVPLTGLMRSVLVGIGPFEPLALLAPIGVLIAVSVMASAGPAFRAASIDPIQTLREP